MRFVFAVLMVLGLASAASAQSATPTSKFQWRTSDSAESVSNYQWQLELDGTVQSTPLAASCSAGVCEAPIPAITPTSHTVRLRPVDVSVLSEPLEGPFTDPLTFTMRAVPSKPTAFVVIPGG